MKISEITEAKVEMCPDACCGKPVTECKCGPDCKHCDCYEKNKVNETASAGGTSAGSVAAVGSSLGKTISRNMYNADGTMKNALDQDNVLSNGKPKKKTSKSSK